MANAELYLYLSKKELQEAIGKEVFTDSDTSEEEGKIIDLKEGYTFRLSEFYVEDENIHINGDIVGPKGIVVGWQQIDAPLDLDLAAQIIEVYTKKINRIKTIMQAVEKT